MEHSSGSVDAPPLERRSDGDLLLAWRAGDREAGELLFERHYARVALFFQNKVAEPDELIQRTFLAAIEAADRFRANSSFRAYLLGIAYNLLRNHYRVLQGPRNHARLPTTSVEAMGQTPCEIISEREEERLLLAALRRLEPDLQVLLELYYWEQLKTKELAEVLEWPVGTVRDRLRRSRRKLEDEIRELATSGDKLHTTLTRLDDWAQSIRERVEAKVKKDDDEGER